jgi:hypothetical protein
MVQEFFFSLMDCFNLELTSEAICKYLVRFLRRGISPLCDLHLHRATQAGKPCGYIFVPQVGFKPTIVVFERRKPIHVPSRETLWWPRNVPTTVEPGKEFPRVVPPLLLPFLLALALISSLFHLYGWITRSALEGNGSSARTSPYPHCPWEFFDCLNCTYTRSWRWRVKMSCTHITALWMPCVSRDGQEAGVKLLNWRG